MDAQDKKWNRIVRFLILIPLVMGTVGLLETGKYRFWDALFNSIQMFFLNYEEPAENILINISRFLAPVVTAGNVLLIIASASRYIRAQFIRIFGTKPTTAIYGDPEIVEILAKQFKGGAFVGGESLLKADRYLLMWNEEKNLEFYTRYEVQLKEKQVYLKCSALRTQEISKDNMKLVSADEIASRLFWQQANLFNLYESKGRDLSIVFIGFGFLGEELLNYGLQMNIFSPNQHFTYDIFGDDEHYLQLHHELANISDSIKFHQEPWEQSLTTLSEADFVVVCRQDNQLTLVRNLLFSVPGIQLQIFAAEGKLINLLGKDDRCNIFEWQSAALKLDNIFDDKTMNRAKRINLRYAHIYRNIEETEANGNAEWAKLSPFIKNSNISAADYHEIRLQMLQYWNVREIGDLSQKQLELLSQLEHIRWCRFYYINNWRYCKGVKDPILRLHQDLRPYEELNEEDKKKDMENIRILMAV